MSQNANATTREYFDAIMVESRLIGSDLADTSFELFGSTFKTPIMMAALSHLNSCHPEGLVEMARGAKAAGAVMWCGMGPEEELSAICATGARTIKIIKPYADEAKIEHMIDHAKACGCLAVGMDIDHAFTSRGTYDVVLGEAMTPKGVEDLKRYVARAGIPFVVKGVLSVQDALACVEAGVAGIVVSHHHSIMPYAVPPLMLLPEIVDAVAGRMKIFVDCGIESGADAFKCLAMGADAVSVGRAMMDPLHEQGAEGVVAKVAEMTGELVGFMARTGMSDLEHMDASVLYLRDF